MGVLDTSYTFANTDTITSTKMNNIIDQSTFTNDAIFGNTLELVSGQLKVRALGITSAELGTNSVTTAAIGNGTVTSAKLGYSISIAGNLSVTGTSTFTGASTFAVKPTFTDGCNIGRIGGGVASFRPVNGTSDLYAARAWGRFSGGASPALVNGQNISAIRSTGTGQYIVTLGFGIPSNPAILVTSDVASYVTSSSNITVYLSFLNSTGSSYVNPSSFGLVVFA